MEEYGEDVDALGGEEVGTCKDKAGFDMLVNMFETQKHFGTPSFDSTYDSEDDDDISYNSSYDSDVNFDDGMLGARGYDRSYNNREDSNLLNLLDHQLLICDDDDEALLSEEEDNLDIDIGSSSPSPSSFTQSIEELCFCDFDQPLFTIVEEEQLLSMNVKKNHALFTTAKESDADGDEEDFDFEYVSTENISDLYHGRNTQQESPLDDMQDSDLRLCTILEEISPDLNEDGYGRKCIKFDKLHTSDLQNRSKKTLEASEVAELDIIPLQTSDTQQKDKDSESLLLPISPISPIIACEEDSESSYDEDERKTFSWCEWISYPTFTRRKKKIESHASGKKSESSIPFEGVTSSPTFGIPTVSFSSLTENLNLR